MSAPLIQGWCPGALRPMRSGDGLVVRIRAPLGRLSAEQTCGIAALARDYGNGLLDLSARANLQLRGVREAAHPALIEGLSALGLLDSDATLEARRNITLTPFWGMHDAAPRLARALEAALARADAPRIPGKFGFAVDCGEAPVLSDISADIRLERAQGGFLIRADGAETGALVQEAEAVDCATELAHWFLATGGAPDGRGRMRQHLARGAALPTRYCAAERPKAAVFAPVPCLVATGALVALAFGQISAEAFGALGALRLTPWRMLLLEGATALPRHVELMSTPDDPLLRVSACTGAPGCLQGLQQTRGLARALAPYVPKSSFLHVSGCAKGCAHPRLAPLTLTATAQGYDFIRDGDAAAPPLVSGLALDAALIAREF